MNVQGGVAGHGVAGMGASAASSDSSSGGEFSDQDQQAVTRASASPLRTNLSLETHYVVAVSGTGGSVILVVNKGADASSMALDSCDYVCFHVSKKCLLPGDPHNFIRNLEAACQDDGSVPTPTIPLTGCLPKFAPDGALIVGEGRVISLSSERVRRFVTWRGMKAAFEKGLMQGPKDIYTQSDWEARARRLRDAQRSVGGLVLGFSPSSIVSMLHEGAQIPHLAVRGSAGEAGLPEGDSDDEPPADAENAEQVLTLRMRLRQLESRMPAYEVIAPFVYVCVRACEEKVRMRGASVCARGVEGVNVPEVEFPRPCPSPPRSCGIERGTCVAVLTLRVVSPGCHR